MAGMAPGLRGILKVLEINHKKNMINNVQNRHLIL
jgi:hypothetical protein